MSRRAFARDRGVNHSAVNKGITTGRLSKSIGKDGKISDLGLARREWENNRAKVGPATNLDDELDQEIADCLLASLRYVLSVTPARRFVRELDPEAGRCYFDAPALLEWLLEQAP